MTAASQTQRARSLPSRRFYRRLLLLSLATLLTLATTAPLVRALWLGYLALTAFLSFSLPGAERSYRIFGLGTTLVEILWLTGALQHRGSGLLLLLMIIVFICSSLHGLILCLSLERQVDGAVVAGATAGYLLLGLTGGLVLSLLAGLHPGSFHDSLSGQPLNLPPLGSLAEASLSWDRHFQQINYFAFVSLTTVGYGDITPGHPLLQFASVALSVLGPLYMAVVLGVLISRIQPLTARPDAQWEDRKRTPPRARLWRLRPRRLALRREGRQR
ncbi:MAG: potassium channel family protein [Cyanobium sp.]